MNDGVNQKCEILKHAQYVKNLLEKEPEHFIGTG